MATHVDRVTQIALADGTLVSDSNPLPTTGSSSGGGVINSGAFTDHSGTLTSSNVSQTVMAANPSRKMLLFQNNSSETVWIDFGMNAGFTSLKLESGAGFELDAGGLSLQSVTVIGASSGLSYFAKELL